jgi:SAM-dependent methyltransferase
VSAFFDLYGALQREGPGDRESLDWALSVARPAPDAVVLDAGCGSGADVPGLLAHVPRGRVVAIDLHAPFIDRVRSAHDGDQRVRAEVADMADPPGGPFDLIWSAGAIYFMGVTAGLKSWRRHLSPSGRVAFSQVGWAVDFPSATARAFWDAEYPEMTTREGVLGMAAAAGYRVVADRWLPRAGWEAYYAGLQARIDALRRSAVGVELEGILTATEREIAVWHAHGDDYGYLQVVAEPA